MAKHGKKYLEAKKQIDPTQQYAPDRRGEAGARTRPSPSSTAQSRCTCAWALIRATPTNRCAALFCLPSGTGKEVRILVFAEGDAARIAEEAGADFVGSDELVNKIQGGWTDFDMAIATPPMMKKVGRLGRVLVPAA